jgi:hypothetical protein
MDSIAEWVIAREGAIGPGGPNERRFDHHGPSGLYPQRERDAHRLSEPQSGAAKGGARGGGGDCTSNLTNFSVALISARRYPMVDVEQQVVLSMGIFLRKPGVKQLRKLLAEWFFVEDGRIRNIWASIFYPTNDLPFPNWPPYDGNFPFPAEFAAPAAAPAPAAVPGRGASK